jgi:hypothetical protein
MVGTHPLLHEGRHGRQWRVKTIQMPVEVAIVARKHVLP